jgi:hypothetical protein
MNSTQTLMQEWRSFLVFKKERKAPLWVRLLVGATLALGIALALTLVSVFLTGRDDSHWWRATILENLLLGACAACAILLIRRALELALPSCTVDAMAAKQDWRPLALMSAVLVGGLVLGVRSAFGLLGQFYNFELWKKMSGIPLFQLKFLIFALLTLAANWIWWLLRAKETALAQQAAESQLRMLQAQIEPHFLFNTLANVQSLIASDGPRAQLMLESFTDYLRASLGQMRVGDSTLDAELDTARNYLQLMQIRMEERLRFTIDASEQARLAVLPPLLLQPLVENAVHHGLEPKVAGGTVRLSASVHEGQLEIRIDDDGMGLDHARRPLRAGNGVALVNIRARLQTRYGAQASLLFEPRDEGTRVLLRLPFQASV